MYCKETIHVVLISFAVVFGPLVFKKEPVDWTSAFKSFYSQHCWPNMNTWMGKYGNFPSQNPKWVQNLQFTLLSETTSIPVTFIWESPPPPPSPRQWPTQLMVVPLRVMRQPRSYWVRFQYDGAESLAQRSQVVADVVSREMRAVTSSFASSK